MRVLIATALLCLFTFTAEVTMDPSTSFVRSEPRPAAGKLVVASDYSKLKSIEKPPGDSANKCPLKSAGHDQNEYGSANSHAGNIPTVSVLIQTLLVTHLIASSETPYEEPRLGNPLRPPALLA